MAQITDICISAFPWGLQTTVLGCDPALHEAVTRGLCLGKTTCVWFWCKSGNCSCESTPTHLLYLGSRGHTWRKSMDSKDNLLSELHHRLCPLLLTSSSPWWSSPDAKRVSPADYSPGQHSKGGSWLWPQGLEELCPGTTHSQRLPFSGKEFIIALVEGGCFNLPI